MKINKLNESMIPSQEILDDCLDDYLHNAFGYNGVEDYVATQYPNHPSEWQARICDYLKQHKNESLSLKEWNEFSDDDVEDDIAHSNVYGGDSKYCPECGSVKEYDEDGFAFCTWCNEHADDQFGVHQFSTSSIIFRGTEEECGKYIDDRKELWSDAEVYRITPDDPHYIKNVDESLGEEDFIEVDDPSIIDKLDYAGAVEMRGNKVYADANTLRQLKNDMDNLTEAKIFGAKAGKKLQEAGELLPIEVLNPDDTPKQYDVKFMELEKVPGLLNWDIADQLQKRFRDNKLWVDELYFNEAKDCIEYDINSGDWKHEHLRSKWLLEELFKELGIIAKIDSYTTEEDGSDNYSAHYTVRAIGKVNEALKESTTSNFIPEVGMEVLYRGKITSVIDVENDPKYGIDVLIKNPNWNGEDTRFENIWVGDQVDPVSE